MVFDNKMKIFGFALVFAFVFMFLSNNAFGGVGCPVGKEIPREGCNIYIFTDNQNRANTTGNPVADAANKVPYCEGLGNTVGSSKAAVFNFLLGGKTLKIKICDYHNTVFMAYGAVAIYDDKGLTPVTPVFSYGSGNTFDYYLEGIKTLNMTGGAEENDKVILTIKPSAEFLTTQATPEQANLIMCNSSSSSNPVTSNGCKMKFGKGNAKLYLDSTYYANVDAESVPNLTLEIYISSATITAYLKNSAGRIIDNGTAAINSTTISGKYYDFATLAQQKLGNTISHYVITPIIQGKGFDASKVKCPFICKPVSTTLTSCVDISPGKMWEIDYPAEIIKTDDGYSIISNTETTCNIKLESGKKYLCTKSNNNNPRFYTYDKGNDQLKFCSTSSGVFVDKDNVASSDYVKDKPNDCKLGVAQNYNKDYNLKDNLQIVYKIDLNKDTGNLNVFVKDNSNATPATNKVSKKYLKLADGYLFIDFGTSDIKRYFKLTKTGYQICVPMTEKEKEATKAGKAKAKEPTGPAKPFWKALTDAAADAI